MMLSKSQMIGADLNQRVSSVGRDCNAVVVVVGRYH